MANPPRSLTATSTSSTEITVTWSLGTGVSGYRFQELQYQTLYSGGWRTLSASIDGEETSYTGITAIPNMRVEFRVRGQDRTTEDWSDWSNTDSTTCGADTIQDRFVFRASSTDIIGSTAVEEDVEATINFSGYSLDAGSVKTTYAYYLADSTGAVYQYSGDYKSDSGTAIPCRWQSKETNFVDQYKELENRQKNVHYIRLYYVDLDSSTSVTAKISTDGGVTWDAGVTKSLGTGDGKNKSSDFYFNDGPVSGQLFTVAVETATTANRFQLTAIGLMFEPGGEDFSLS